LQAKKKKNVEFNSLGDKLGRVHMDRQDFGQLQTRKMKALKRTAKEAHPDETSA
jgi:ribosome production factor 2